MSGSAAPRVLLSRSVLMQNAQGLLASSGGVVDLRHDAYGHGLDEVAPIVLEAGASAMRVGSVEEARRLEAAGIESARGFTTNVANYRPQEAEEAYAEELVTALAARGLEGKRYIIDTGRNGGDVDAGERCNPVGARSGSRPRECGRTIPT